MTLRGDLENFARTRSTVLAGPLQCNERVSVSDTPPPPYQLLLSCSSPLSPLELRDLF